MANSDLDKYCKALDRYFLFPLRFVHLFSFSLFYFARQCHKSEVNIRVLFGIWFYRLRSSAITIAGSQTIAEVCFHMIADDRRTFCDLRSAIVCDHMETSLKKQGPIFAVQQSPLKSRLLSSLKFKLPTQRHFLTSDGLALISILFNFLR